MRLRSSELTKEIIAYYNGRCARCHTDYQLEIHEIKPKSSFGTKGNPFTLKNSILLCHKCHSWVHNTGTKTTLPELLQCQKVVEDSYAK